MKNLLAGITMLLLTASMIFSAPDSGQMWLIKFKPGHSFIEELHPDSLAKLDIIMRDIPKTSVIWFYGAADAMLWKGHNEHFSSALDGGKRIDRALELRQRYPYRNINISATHEQVTGVKVVWYQETTIINHDTTYNVNNVQNVYVNNVESKLRLQAGLSSWIPENNVFILPFIGVLVERGDWAFGGKAGALPFVIEDSLSNSFVAGHVQRMFNQFGVSGQLFYSWEYFTHYDTWTKKAFGISLGAVIIKDRFELNVNVMAAQEVFYDLPDENFYIGVNILGAFYIK